MQSGGAWHAQHDAEALYDKLNYLQKTKRYEALLAQMIKANDKNNFLALVLEANFAYQFESQKLNLTYEVKQNVQQGSSIDFLCKTPDGDSVFFELRLLQQAKAIADSISEQLHDHNAYCVSLNDHQEQDAIVRIQNTVVGKVQDKDGNPIKFFSTAAGVVNLVVVDTTAGILQIDIHDCMLATMGDPGVEPSYRRQIFGLFQEDRPEYPQHIRDLAVKYSHIRNTLHGVLFLFKKRGTGILAYNLEQYLMWNPAIIGREQARRILGEITSAIPIRQ